VLLVEDDDAVRKVAARILRDQGYAVLEARRPDEARGIGADPAFIPVEIKRWAQVVKDAGITPQ
jgi:DNA-binding response OmpR family regulator